LTFTFDRFSVHANYINISDKKLQTEIFEMEMPAQIAPVGLPIARPKE